MKCSMFRMVWIYTLAFLLQQYVALGAEGRETGIAPLNCSPLLFEENQGQFPDAVKFASRGFKGHVFLAPTGFRIEIKDHNSTSYLGLDFANSNPAVKLEGKETASGVVSYLLGNDPSKWRTGIPSWRSVIYRELYPGIDLLCYGKDGQLEYDFILEPGAGPDQITLSFNGQENIEISEQGHLIIRTGSGTIRHTRPLAYQEIDGNKVNVECTYALSSPSSVQFQVAGYDKSRPLIIDPVIVYSTYLGGDHHEKANDVVADNAGNLYMVGTTYSTNFPLSGSPFQEVLNSTNSDVFVSKFSADGSTLIYSTYLGGNNNDDGRGIAADSEGNVYITGNTKSTNFPVKNAYQQFNGGNPPGSDNDEIFVTKLDNTGTNLVFSTYFGSIQGELGNAVGIDAAGNVYIAGIASSGDFPATNGYQTVYGGQVDGVVVKFDASGTNLVYATYLGGSNYDGACDIAVDSAGYAYVFGETSSSNFPTLNAWNSTYGGGTNELGDPAYDTFLTKFVPMGTSLVYSTYLGGNNDDFGLSVCIDGAGASCVAGRTYSTNFPTTNAYQSIPTSGGDAFIAKFSAAGTSLLYSTYLGGMSYDGANGIVLDSASNFYVVGYTYSSNFPMHRAFQTNVAGTSDGFITEISADGTNILFSTFFGGDGDDSMIAVAVDPQDFIYAVGYTGSTNFPTVDAFQSGYGGDAGAEIWLYGGDAVALKIGPPYFTAISKSGSGIQMYWRSFSNLTYDVQYKTNLSEGTWMPFTNHTATGLTATVEDLSPATSRFYRVAE